MERIFCNDFKRLKDGNASLSMILNEKGGIIDDSIVTRFPDHFNVVLNAGNKHIDMEHITRYHEEEFKNKDITIETHFEDKALIALQGPKAAEVLQKFVKEDLTRLPFMGHLITEIPSINAKVQICRCGYTGEDGFEISVLNEKAESLCDIIFQDEKVAPAGLGARDSLR